VQGINICEKGVSLNALRQKVGLVFQYPEYQLFEETVEKDVAFGPKNLGLPQEEIDQRVREALELVGLDYDAVAERSPFELSGGQKRRVAIAGVVAMRPSVLILDEPTAGLDPAAHDEVLAMIETINASMNMIVIFVSHNMADVARLSDRVLVMDKGKIAMQGTPREVFSHEDELSSMGLGVPPVRDILKKIKEAVPGFESDALTTDEAAEDIRKYFGLK
jgi:energy-coupling factor transport system ATP-binding protein